MDPFVEKHSLPLLSPKISTASPPSSAASTPRSAHMAKFDESSFPVGQSLSSILNNPRSSKSGMQSSDLNWAWMLQSNPDAAQDAPPPLAPGLLPDVQSSEFESYLSSVSEPWSRFWDVRQYASLTNVDGDGSADAAEGEGLQACVREVPPIYFDADFALHNASTFQTACPLTTLPGNMMLQEKLAHYLDLVEGHLTREIAARSDSFFQALHQLEELNSHVQVACQQISALQKTVRLLDSDVVEAARKVQAGNTRRDNLVSLENKLKLLSFVDQAVATLQLLVSSADCAAALDVIDDLRRVQESNELIGFHCFRQLPLHLSQSMEAVNTMLTADFVREAIHSSADLGTHQILVAYSPLKELPPISAVKWLEGNLLQEEMESAGKESMEDIRERLLPIIIGLLRTFKLPAVLRAYRETLVTDIKAAIKTVVEEMLPVLSGDSAEGSKDTSAELDGQSLAAKLRALSADSFVHLLTAVYAIVKKRLQRASLVRKMIELLLEGSEHDEYTQAAVNAAFSSGALQALKEESQAASPAKPAGAGKVADMAADSASDPSSLLTASSVSSQFRVEVLRENAESVWAACDTAQGRWVKLLGVRAPLNSKLSLSEFGVLHDLAGHFVAYSEQVGGRLGYTLRGTLQSQSKSFVDSHHSAQLTKIVSQLDREAWVAVDAAADVQHIVDTLSTSEQHFLVTAGDDDGHISGRNGISPLENGTNGSVAAAAASGPECTNGYGQQQASKTAEESTSGQQSTLPAQSTAGGEKSVDGRAGEEQEKAPPLQSAGNQAADQGGKVGKPAGKVAIKTLHLKGLEYHMVESGMVMLRIVWDYLLIANTLPSLTTEVVHRTAEILKLFNSRACQLVLGAGAMQVSGLKSITAKHLALSSQCISSIFVLIPDIRRLLSRNIPESRKVLLLTELDRVAQDYGVHRDEVHSKLVAIMRERLQVHLRSLPTTVEGWNRPADEDSLASQFARALSKEVGVLLRVLSPILLDSDTRSVFTRVAQLYHAILAESLAKIEVSTPQGKKRLQRDVEHILQCIRSLPTSFAEKDDPRELDVFLKSLLSAAE